MSAVTGSAFSAIALCNSYLFQLPIFCMGLPYYHQLKFQNKRFFSVVLLENIPQLIIQVATLYLSIQVGIGVGELLITILSMIFTIISLFLSGFEYVLSKKIIKSSKILLISFIVESKEIEELDEFQFFARIALKKFIIVQHLAKILHIQVAHVERLMPIQTEKGVQLKFVIDAESVGFNKVYKLVWEILMDIADAGDESVSVDPSINGAIGAIGNDSMSSKDSKPNSPELRDIRHLKSASSSKLKSSQLLFLKKIERMYQLNHRCRVPRDSIKVLKINKQRSATDIAALIVQSAQVSARNLHGDHSHRSASEGEAYSQSHKRQQSTSLAERLGSIRIARMSKINLNTHTHLGNFHPKHNGQGKDIQLPVIGNEAIDVSNDEARVP